MYGFTRALLIFIPIAVVTVAAFNGLDASRPVAIAASTVVVMAAGAVGVLLEIRHGGLRP